MIYTVTLNPAVDRELTVESIELDTVLRASQSQVDYGGKGFNVSRQLMALGTPSIALGFAGGRSGELLRDGLSSLGIETDFVWIEGETRTNVSIVSAQPRHYIKANEAGPAANAEEQATLLSKIERLARPGDLWVLAGSLPPGAPDTIYAQMIERLRRRGAQTVLDSSGKALEYGCKAGPNLVKPNAYEAGQITRLPVENLSQIRAAAEAMVNMGPEGVVISLGRDGAVMYEGGRAWAARSPRVDERNPIGAGDSMVGGLVYGLQAGLAWTEALRWGVACGAATASLSGTAVGERRLVEGLLRQVTLDRIG